jgi:3-hydroxy-9,10-secoandrosta-1,3,5(10)-triene-9,17-dione monooxygenase reductase component
MAGPPEGASGAAGLGPEPARFREVLGHFATGVTVVTGMDERGAFGFSCQAFSALSLDPPLVMMAPSRTSESWPRIEASGRFCVNVLAEHQEVLSRTFATKGTHKFDGVGWRPSPGGCPVLSEVLAWVDCEVEAVHDGGDHLVVVGRVRGLGTEEGPLRRPLIFYRGGYGRFEV